MWSCVSCGRVERYYSWRLSYWVGGGVLRVGLVVGLVRVLVFSLVICWLYFGCVWFVF